MNQQFEQEKRARAFAEKWKGEWKENAHFHNFWRGIIEIFDSEIDTDKYLNFQKPVKKAYDKDSHQKFIDVYIPSASVLVEHKSSGIDLSKNVYEQAKFYADNLIYNERPRYIITSNFSEIWVYDLNKNNLEPAKILVENLGEEYNRLSFLVADKDTEPRLEKEKKVSIRAGEVIENIRKLLLAEYEKNKSVEPEKYLKSLNMLCVRIVFCLYAEDAGLFGQKGLFGDYVKKFKPEQLRKALLELFKVLDIDKERREKEHPYLEPDLAAFPYVNGGLFTEEDTLIPQFNADLKHWLFYKGSREFDWAEISPTIFGSIFESTLGKNARHDGGMHYTSIENIHRVIDPLFLDELNAEYREAIAEKVIVDRNKKLNKLHNKLSKLTFFDPACGSGNFLTETYLSLRRLENKILEALNKYGFTVLDNVKVSINQFYGIEVNDFAVAVAKTALWIAESQMMKETALIAHDDADFLPLKQYDNIVEGNALQMSWGGYCQLANAPIS